MKDLDKKDWQILELVCNDARLSHSQIARKVALSKNAVTYKIERLVKMGIITGFFTIIDHNLFGMSFYEILVKLNADKHSTREFIDFLKKHDKVMILDRLSGEWNFVFQIGCKNVQELFDFINEFKSMFFSIIDTFETHPILESYKVEQLPVELIKDAREHPSFKQTRDKIKVDLKDKRLLLELNKNATLPLHELAEKLHMTYETISARIKKLKQNGIIIKFTAKISLKALGYDVYLVSLELRNLSKQLEQKLRGYIIENPQVRYSYISTSKPQVFVYLAVKNSDELDSFLNNLKENFPENIVTQKFSLSKEQYKYDLFTPGML